MCVREKDVRASFLGYNIFLVKLTAFAVAGLMAGLAGGLFAIYQEVVATSCIDNNMSMIPVLMVVIGGPSHFLGPVVGAAFYVVFQDGFQHDRLLDDHHGGHLHPYNPLHSGRSHQSLCLGPELAIAGRE